MPNAEGPRRLVRFYNWNKPKTQLKAANIHRTDCRLLEQYVGPTHVGQDVLMLDGWWEHFDSTDAARDAAMRHKVKRDRRLREGETVVAYEPRCC